MIIVKIHLGISLDCVGSVVSLQFQIFPCSSLYLFSRSRGPLQCTVNVNYRVLIRCTCHFPAVPSSLFILALSVCKPLQCLISALTQEGEGGHLFRLTCSVILLGGRDTANRYHWRVYVGSAPSVWTTLGLPQLKMVCASRVYTAQAPGFSARVLSQVGPEFRAHLRSKLLRFLGTPQRHRPGWDCVLCPSQVRAAQATRCLASAPSQVSCVS